LEQATVSEALTHLTEIATVIVATSSRPGIADSGLKSYQCRLDLGDNENLSQQHLGCRGIAHAGIDYLEMAFAQGIPISAIEAFLQELSKESRIVGCCNSVDS
jgi:hypothetical protein